MKVEATEDMPDFLLPLRERAAAFAGLEPAALQQVLLTEYGPGAGIGWHKDRSVFGEVVGISLLSPCVFRLRRRTAAKPRPAWERRSLTLAPRSAYLLSGPARTDWEHSIPEVESAALLGDVPEFALAVSARSWPGSARPSTPLPGRVTLPIGRRCAGSRRRSALPRASRGWPAQGRP